VESVVATRQDDDPIVLMYGAKKIIPTTGESGCNDLLC
jgi:hypothetical protein